MAGVTLEIVAVLTLKGTVFDHTPIWHTRAVPDAELSATVAKICVSLQLTIAA